MMDFKTFQATRRFSIGIPEDMHDEKLEGPNNTPCFRYGESQHLYIEICTDGEFAGQFCATISNWSDCSYSLTELEAELYNFYTHN